MDAVLFDMDGVLVDSVAHKYGHWEQVLRDEFGLTAVDLETLIGLNIRDKYEYLVDSHGFEGDRQRFVRLLNEDVDRIYEEQVDLLPDIEASLQWLAEESVSTGLVSAASRPKVDTVVDRFALDTRLDVVVSADDIDDDSKPDPAIYHHAAGELGVEPTNCLVVEDSTHGITAATRAGAYCIAYAPPAAPDREVGHAHELVTSPTDLHDRIRAVVSGDAEW